MKFPLSKYIWFDGKLVPVNMAKVPVTTHAIHYGTSIFEGIRAYWNSKNLYVFRLKDHIKRFRNSGQFYNITLNFSDKQIENAVIDLCKKNKIKKSSAGITHRKQNVYHVKVESKYNVESHCILVQQRDYQTQSNYRSHLIWK